MAASKPFESTLARGLLVGLVAASIGALYTVFARWGISRGMDSSDMTFLRFGVAGGALCGADVLQLITQTS